MRFSPTLYRRCFNGFTRRVKCRFDAVVFLFTINLLSAGEFIVASYNLENFVGENTQGRPVKSVVAKAKIVESILAVKPDVLAVQEIGQRVHVKELQNMLKTNGLDLPNVEFVDGPDPVINLAVLSRFPLRGTTHSKVQFLLGKRRLLVSRGFSEVQVRVAPGYSFTLLNVHLKSKRPVSHADEAALRFAEAEALREIVEKRLTSSPNLNLIVVGDLNDAPDTRPIKTIVGRGKRKLVDLRPFERNGDKAPSANRHLPRRVTWTSYYEREDSYSRFDYLLASPGMARELVREGTYVLAIPDWGVGSDHRPVVATFTDRDE